MALLGLSSAAMAWPSWREAAFTAGALPIAAPMRLPALVLGFRLGDGGLGEEQIDFDPNSHLALSSLSLSSRPYP